MKLPRCPIDASHELSFAERHDAYYCLYCNEWLEAGCDDKNCFYCKRRPKKPLGRQSADGDILIPEREMRK